MPVGLILAALLPAALGCASLGFCSGHGRCAGDGRCICNAGFDGPDCSVIIQVPRTRTATCSAAVALFSRLVHAPAAIFRTVSPQRALML